MKIKAIRGFIYDKKTVEAGRVIDVADSFGHWAVAKGKAEEVKAKGKEDAAK